MSEVPLGSIAFNPAQYNISQELFVAETNF